MASTKRIFKIVVIAFLLWMLLLVSTASTSLSEDRQVFLLTKSATIYNLTQIDWMSGNQKILASIPFTSSLSLADVLDAEGQGAVEKFFAIQSPMSGDVQDFMRLSPLVQIQSITVAPDKGQIALNMRVQRCTRYPRTVCFGIVQIMLVDMAGNQRVVFSTGMNSSKYFGQYNGGEVSEAFISDVQWTANQEALVIRLGDQHSSQSRLNAPLVVVPIIKNVPPFKIGDAQTFTLETSSYIAAAVSHNDADRQPDTLNLIKFDPLTGLTSSTNTLIGTYITNPYFGITCINNKLLFWIERDIKADWGGTFGLINLSQPGEVVVLPSALGQPVKTQTLSNSKAVITQGKDGTLWRIVITDNALQADLLVKEPVNKWMVGRNGEILIQLKGHTDYSIIDEQGALMGTLKLETILLASEEGLAIGW